jgi:ATP-dependent Clp protease ATP-binding subunit ClpA
MPTLESFVAFVFRSTSATPTWRRSASALHLPETFSQGARRVSVLAHEHAFRLHADAVGVDHLLLALLDDHRALALLQEAGANAGAVRRAIAPRLLPASEGAEYRAVLPKTSTLHKAWKDAHVIAERRGARLIEPEHLLLALVVPSRDGRLSNTARDLVASGFGHT